ncbi:helix-turn-helix transcriptional regulator [Enterobacter asburiae]|uniref:helix-turn-helix domain-containing protein n=1 Tax=Enterobacter TaxID=547 RepID=UPI000B9FA375|nr:helix-turn-helix transcriptional regulator [Enterobacter asburiae]MCE1344859.1 helix-turn-helix transcriptional regulator [Enterobacter asburiae]OZP65469.1 transcriptional regulator [Enterobacter asburiae]QBB03599.1 XRE family transcriptional regulator [Enterobacter cloacae]
MNRIAQERKRIGLTQAELASALGWKPSRLSNYELGIRKPSLDDCRSIVDGLRKSGSRCTLDDVFPYPSSEV